MHPMLVSKWALDFVIDILMFLGMVMDWREIAGYPTVHGLAGDDRRGWSVFRGAYSSDGEKLGTGTWLDLSAVYQWDGRTDPMRGWVVAGCWLVTSLAECV